VNASESEKGGYQDLNVIVLVEYMKIVNVSMS